MKKYFQRDAYNYLHHETTLDEAYPIQGVIGFEGTEAQIESQKKEWNSATSAWDSREPNPELLKLSE